MTLANKLLLLFNVCVAEAGRSFYIFWLCKVTMVFWGISVSQGGWLTLAGHQVPPSHSVTLSPVAFNGKGPFAHTSGCGALQKGFTEADPKPHWCTCLYVKPDVSKWTVQWSKSVKMENREKILLCICRTPAEACCTRSRETENSSESGNTG